VGIQEVFFNKIEHFYLKMSFISQFFLSFSNFFSFNKFFIIFKISVFFSKKDELKLNEKSFLNFIDQQEEDFSLIESKNNEHLNGFNNKDCLQNYYDEENYDEIIAYEYAGKTKIKPKDLMINSKKNKQKHVEEGIFFF